MFSALVLSTVLASVTIDQNTASLMTDVVTTAFSEDPRLDVVSSADVKRQLAFEAEKQAVGCQADESCLAEIAAAMGARFVVHGQLGTLEDVVVLTLNLFDSEASQAAVRTVVKDRSLAALSDKVGPAVKVLVQRFMANVPEGTRPRVLVLSITEPKATPPAPPPSTGATARPVLWWSGIATGAIGVVVVGVGGFFVKRAYDADAAIDGNLGLRATEAKEAYAARNRDATTGLWTGSVGVAGLVIGATLMAFGADE